MSHTVGQYVLLFSVRFNNSDRFQIYVVTHSYSSYPFLCTLDIVIGIAKRKFGKYTYKTMMGRKNKISHTGIGCRVQLPYFPARLLQQLFVLENEKSGDPPIHI